jgi:hypothetical protein
MQDELKLDMQLSAQLNQQLMIDLALHKSWKGQFIEIAQCASLTSTYL